MSDTPTFSVIMACHNAAPYVQQAIASVVGQTFTDWEMIVVDDASQDDSLIYIEKAASIEPKIKVIKFSQNAGPAMARNAAIKIAKGEWLSILDSDDIYFPYKLEKQFEIIRQHNSNLVLVGGGCVHIDSEGLIGKKYKYPSNSKKLKKNLYQMLKFPAHSSIIYRKSAFLEVGGFNALFLRSQDSDLLLRLSDVGDFTSSNIPLIKYRLHSNNISRVITKEGFSQLEYGIAARVCSMLRKNGSVDPSATGDTFHWNDFITHVALIVRQSKYTKYENFLIDLMQDNKGASKFFDIFKIVINVLSKIYSKFIQLRRNRLIRGELSNEVYKYWIVKEKELNSRR